MRGPVRIGVIAALVVMLVGIGLWLKTNDSTEKPNGEQVAKAGPKLPRDSGATLLFTTRDGERITVPDFTYTHPSLDITDTGETYVYVTQNDAGQEMNPNYGIVYGNDGTLVIGLLAAPLSNARLEAEIKLRELMEGVPDDILCRLPITVAVPDTIDPSYAGKELGLSFCPGSVALP